MNSGTPSLAGSRTDPPYEDCSLDLLDRFGFCLRQCFYYLRRLAGNDKLFVGRNHKDLNGAIGTIAGGASEGAMTYQEIATKAGIKKDGPYVGESYDAGALIALAMQAAGSADRAAIQSKVMMVANAPGEKIMPGEIAKGLKILKDGGDIDYVGATSVEFNDIGEVLGTFLEKEVQSGEFKTNKVH